MLFAVKKVLSAPAIKHGTTPAVLYLLMFCLLTWPLCLKFNTHFFADAGDGLQNVWNLWWVNLAVRHPDLYPSVWQTPLLHWPFGVTLIGQTLNPFNGYVAVVLLQFLSLTAAHNTIVVSAFVLGGLTTYWLAFYVSRSFWGSIIAGFVFTFSSYHFMHAEGHLQCVSLEWIPLFVLCWYVLITRPSATAGTFAAIVFWLVLLCDYYYFVYCILAAILIIAWYAFVRRDAWLIVRMEYRLPVAAFMAVALSLTGPIVSHLLLTNYNDPLIGAHDPTLYSLDFLALIIPGGHWLFNQWTRFYWSRLPGNINESSVYLGLSVYVVLVYLWMRRRALDPEARRALSLWFVTMALFILLALGPGLQVAGNVLWSKVMPYTLLTGVLPFMQLSGVPVRMMVMVTLCASVLCAIGFRELFRQFPGKRTLTVVLLVVLVFETLPRPLPATRVEIPEYVIVLAGLPDDGGVLELAASGPELLLYYQTVFRKPIVFGFVSRLPTSVNKKDERLAATIGEGDYRKLLNTYHIRYVVTRQSIEGEPGNLCLKTVYDKDDVWIYRLQDKCEP